jgi:hypothetical protein
MRGGATMSEGSCAGAIVEPPWMADLPRLGAGRGFPRPRHFQQLPHLPVSFPGDSTGDPVRAWALALRRRCSVCGCTMRGPVYAFDYGAPTARRVSELRGGIFTSRLPGPAHRSCAIYSALVCPFFKYPTSRRHHGGSQARGDAVILAFSGCGSAYFAEHTETEWGPYSFAYSELVERIEFGASKELRPLYEAAVAADAKVIDISTRLYWGGGLADQQRLEECNQADNVTINLRHQVHAAAARIAGEE